MDIRHEWELPYAERAVVDAIVRYVRPFVAFEFGTFSGSTTCLIADAAPAGGTVHTIDVPEEMIDEFYGRLGVTPEMIGAHLRDRASGGAAIRFHRQLIEDFDFEPLRGSVDFMLIDASHEYEDVREDSHRALSLLSPDGVIVWDDYIGGHPGVTAALNDLSTRISLAHVRRTRLVVHGRGRFAFNVEP